jgi:transcriptional regulator with PAS, ATPase and Fis domain
MAQAASVLAAASHGSIPPDQVIFGTTRRMKELRDNIEKLAQTNIPVLIRGESGTGKEVIAKAIHNRSPLRAAPFLKVVCSAIGGTSLKDDPFGVAKAGSSGGESVATGAVRQATRGTLFLDEIGDLSKALQAKLLQLLQDGQFNPIDGETVEGMDARMISATSRNMEEAMKIGDFRTDLFYRINVASIDLPPLRERKEDIPTLVQYFLERCATNADGTVRSISPGLLRTFEQFSWPGNIRELENAVQRFVALGSESELLATLGEPATPIQATSGRGKVSLKQITKEASRELERGIILRVLAENGGNRRKTARVLNISYRALLYKLKEAAVAGARIPDKVGKS